MLASQWIPDDPELWVPERFPEFLSERRKLLASAANSPLDDLVNGRRPAHMEASVIERGRVMVAEDEDEAAIMARVQGAMEHRGLMKGVEHWSLLSADGTVEQAVLDLAWPDGLEFGGDRVALLLDEPPEVRDAAGAHGFRFFTSEQALLAHADQELLGQAA